MKKISIGATAAAFTAALIIVLTASCTPQNVNTGNPDMTGPAAGTEGIQHLDTGPEGKYDLGGSDVIVYYAVNDSSAGYIKGEAEQRLTAENSKSSSVRAVPNLGYKFVCWSDGIRSEAREGDTAEKSRVITAVFDYDILEMPVFLITTETGGDVTSKTEYINAEIDIINAGEFNLENISTGIRGRGNNTWGYPKKSYKLDLDVKANILGIGKGEAKKWVLLANQCDQSLLRNHIAFEFARSLDGIAFAPASKSVEVYLNREYRGVYLLAEEINVNKNRVDIDEKNIENGTDIGYLVEMTNNANGDTIQAAGRTFQIHNGLSQNEALKYKQLGYITGYINDSWNAIDGGDRTEIESLIDIDSLIDTYLVEEVLKNLDVGWDSYYLYKDRGGKLCFGPLWDFDLSQGNANEGCEYYTGLYVAENLKFQSNQWYYTMMRYTWFRELVLARWDEVREKIMALPAIVTERAESNFNSFSRNFEKWQIFGTSQNRETEFITSLRSYKEHYEYLAEWLGNRIAWIDEHIHTGDYLNGASSQAEEKPRREHRPDRGESSAAGNDATEAIMKNYRNLTGSIKTATIKSTTAGFEGEGIENAFDGNEYTKYCFVCEGETVINFSTENEVKVKAYVFCTANDTYEYPERNPDEWTIYGSNDSKTWSAIDESTEQQAGMEGRNYTYYGREADNPGSYKHYKIVITSSDTLQFSEFIIYG